MKVINKDKDINKDKERDSKMRNYTFENNIFV
jgi:hypothetical protein